MGIRNLFFAAGAALTLSVSATGIAVAQGFQPPDPIEQAMDLLGENRHETEEFDALYDEILAMAEAGSPQAMNFIGVIRQNDVRTDGPSAQDWYRRAIATGDEEVAGLATLNLYSVLVGEAEPGARDLLENIPPVPEGVRPNVAAALGADYLFGLTGPQREIVGIEMIESAVADGYRDGSILPAYADYLQDTNPQRARQLRRMVAEYGSHPDISWQVAMEILESGGPEDEAYALVAEASEQGFLPAQISRAVMLATGQGTPRDEVASRYWYRQAMAQGSAHAARGYGFMLVFGQGGPPNMPLGLALAEMARDAGDENAARLLDMLADQDFDRPSEAEKTAALDALLSELNLKRSDFR